MLGEAKPTRGDHRLSKRKHTDDLESSSSGEDSSNSSPVSDQSTRSKKVKLQHNEQQGRESDSQEESESESGEDVDLESDEHLYNYNNSPAAAGVIHKILITNFMCHEKLEVRLNPCVNFFTGENGSGKSAVLTALSMCLGASAKGTNRALNAKNLIFRGKQKAVLRVEIANKGEEAYRHDLYGDVIVVERTISHKSNGSYTLRDYTNKLVSTKRKDLSDALDFYNIQIDNPVQVLSQDDSREFLQSNDPREKYNFFYMATQLRRLEADYDATQAFLNDLQAIVADTKETERRIKKEWDEAQRQVESITVLRKAQTELITLTNRWAWSKVVDAHNNYKQINANLQEATKAIPKLKQTISTKKAHNDELSQQKAAVLQAVEKIRREGTDLFEENQTMLKNYKEYKSQLRALVNQERDIHGEINSAQADQRNYVKEIQKVKARMNDDKPDRAPFDKLINEHKTKQDEINNTKNELERQQGRARMDKQHLDEEIETLKNKRDRMNGDFRGIKSQYDSAMSAIKNSLDVWGAGAHQVQRLLEKNKHKFSRPPIGPLGQYVKLLDMEFATAVESAIGGALTSYFVDNHHDRVLLEQILKTVANANKTNRTPKISTRKMSYNKYNIQDTRAVSKHPAVIDLIEVGNAQAFNALIDITYMENTIICRSRAEAQAASRNPSNRNIGRILDMKGDEISDDSHFSNTAKARPRFQADNEGVVEEYKARMDELLSRIRSCDSDIQRLRDKLASIIASEKSSTQSLRDANASLVKTQRTINMYQSQRDELAEDADNDQYDETIKAYEAKIAELDEQLHALEASKEDLDVKIKEKQSSNADYLEELTGMKKDEEKRNQAVEENKQQLTNIAEKLQANMTEIQRCTQQIVKLEETKASLEEEAHTAEQECQHEREIALQACDELTPEEAPEVYERMIVGKKRALDAMEKQQGKVQHIEKNLVKVKDKYDQCVLTFKTNYRIRRMLEHALRIRRRLFKRMKNTLKNIVCHHFTKLMGNEGYKGKVRIDNENKLLSITAEPRAKENPNGRRTTKTLSGGERSFSLVCFLIAIWNAMDCPFRALDEFDVYMDMYNRKLSLRLLTKLAIGLKNRQFLFISPQNMDGLVEGPNVRIHRMIDPERDQQRLPFVPAHYVRE